MSMNIEQLRTYVIKDSLKSVNLWNKEGEILLLATALAESDLGTYVHQINGPALGIYQMEPATFTWLWSEYLMNDRYVHIRDDIIDACNFNNEPTCFDMITNLGFASMMCRVRYLPAPEPLPAPEDFDGIADYWKKYYNTGEGKGDSARLSKELRELML